MIDEAGTAPSGEFVRPAPPGPPEPGTHWTAVPDDPAQWAPAEDGKSCRWRGSGDATACGDAAELSKVRGVERRIRWNYCGPHGYREYGRWAEPVSAQWWADNFPEVPEPRRTPVAVMHWAMADD